MMPRELAKRLHGLAARRCQLGAAGAACRQQQAFTGHLRAILDPSDCFLRQQLFRKGTHIAQIGRNSVSAAPPHRGRWRRRLVQIAQCTPQAARAVIPLKGLAAQAPTPRF